jgi:hypothetical protein
VSVVVSPGVNPGVNSVVNTMAAWLDDTVGVMEQAIVRRAMCDIGIVEMPPGSNRSPRIDEYVAAVGSPLGSRWCAAALAAWWRESGATVPGAGGGSCNAWMAWSKRRETWSNAPRCGSAVVYGSKGMADHIGVIVRIEPVLLSVEANTSIAGGFDPNGIAVALKQAPVSRVLGYIAPSAVQPVRSSE